MDPPDIVCFLRLCGDVPCAGGVESRRRREGQVPQPLARSQYSTHSLRCRDGDTALQCAINRTKADGVAYLRSIGAPEGRRPAPPTVNALPPRVAAAACRYALGLRPLRPLTITTGGTGSEMRRVALIWPSLAATTTSVTECVAVLSRRRLHILLPCRFGQFQWYLQWV